MELTAKTPHEVTFGAKVRGYDPAEVDNTDVLRESNPSGEGVLGITNVEGPATDAIDKGQSMFRLFVDTAPPISYASQFRENWGDRSRISVLQGNGGMVVGVLVQL